MYKRFVLRFALPHELLGSTVSASGFLSDGSDGVVSQSERKVCKITQKTRNKNILFQLFDNSFNNCQRRLFLPHSQLPKFWEPFCFAAMICLLSFTWIAARGFTPLAVPVDLIVTNIFDTWVVRKKQPRRREKTYPLVNGANHVHRATGNRWRAHSGAWYRSTMVETSTEGKTRANDQKSPQIGECYFSNACFFTRWIFYSSKKIKKEKNSLIIDSVQKTYYPEISSLIIIITYTRLLLPHNRLFVAY